MENLDRYYQQAQIQWEHGHIDGCIHSLRQVLSLDPEVPDAHALLALCLLHKKRIYAAKYEADLALSLEPGLEMGLFALAVVLIAMRKIDQAAEIMQSLLAQNPNEPLYYRKLAAIYGIKGDKKQVLPLLEKALSLAPSDPETLAELSDYYLHRDLQLAENYAQTALIEVPDHVDALVAMGQVLLKQKRYPEAREHAMWALRNDPESVSALYLLSAIKTRRSRILGLWWRYHSWSMKVGPTKVILVLLSAFIVYRVIMIVSTDMKLENVANVTEAFWLSLVVYSIIGPVLFTRSLKKEIQSIQLDEKF